MSPWLPELIFIMFFLAWMFWITPLMWMFKALSNQSLFAWSKKAFLWLTYEWNDDEITLNFDNFQTETGTTETMRTACAAWSNTVKYRPKNPRYIFCGIQKKKEDIFHEDMFLYMLLQGGEYWAQTFLYNLCCPVSQQQTYGNAQTFPLLLLHCAFGILLYKSARFVVTSDPLEIDNMVLLIP